MLYLYPDPGSRDLVPFWSLYPGSWMGKKIRSGSGIRIREEHPGSYFRELRNHFWGYKYLNSLMRIQIRDQESFWSWIRDVKIRIQDPGLTSRIRNTVQYCIPYCVKAVVWGGPLWRGGSAAGGGGRGARPWAGCPVGPPAHLPPLPPHGGHATGGRSSRRPRHTRPSPRRPGTFLLLPFSDSVVDPDTDRCRNSKAGWIRIQPFFLKQ